MSLPISLIIDDSTPLVNLYWWHAAEAQKTDAPVLTTGEPVARDIPVGFLHDFVDVVQEHGMRGKFSVVPCPGALGKISEGWPGCDMDEMREWIETTRRDIVPLMDITPEMLTHAAALDLETMSPLPENERYWAEHQDHTTLTPYIAAALRLLNEAGLEANGVTSPWCFGNTVEEDYRRAIFEAMKQVNGRGRTWYFLHTDAEATQSLSRVVIREGDDWLVSIVSLGGDYVWDSMETLDDSPAYVHSLADRFVTRDGSGGRLAQLSEAGAPMVLHTHWQSLFSNGRRTGLRALAEAARRVNDLWADRVRWTTCSDLAAEVADGTWPLGG